MHKNINRLSITLVIATGCASATRSDDEFCAITDRHRVEAACINQRRLVIALDDHPAHAVAALDHGSVGAFSPISSAEWKELSRSGQSVAIRGPREWGALLSAVYDSLAPADVGEGCVIDILQREELFIFRDAAGALHAVSLVNKPAAIAVARSYRFSELLAALPAQANTTLYMTGVAGYPIVLAHAGRYVFIAPAAAPAPTRGNKRGLLSATFGGQVQAMVNQPGSSVARLFTLTVSSTKDLVTVEPYFLIEGRPCPAIAQRAGMDLEQWEAALDTMTGSTASSGRMRYLVDGAEYFPRLIELSLAAKQSIDLRTYSFDNDDYAVRYANLLRERSSAIRVRVLVDRFGTKSACMVQSESQPAGHEFPRSIVRHLRDGSQVEARALANPWFAGDHTKAIVIDGRTAFVGGMNIGREYRYDWHDLMVELEGPVVSAVAREFARTWAGSKRFGDFRRKETASNAAPATAADYPVRLLYTRPGDSQILHAQRAAIRRARSRIYIETPYLTSDSLIYELARARRRGVDVRVILPTKGDSEMVNKNHATAINRMLKNGIRVYLYPGMSHLKAAVYDGWACMGSANLDNLSLRVNREMNLATSHAPAVRKLVERVFEPDMERSTEITEPVPTDLSHFFAELISDGL